MLIKNDTKTLLLPWFIGEWASEAIEQRSELIRLNAHTSTLQSDENKFL